MLQLLDKYGGVEHNNVPEEMLNFGHNELLEATTKYVENIFRNNHTTVFGSFWHKEEGWGYKCCLSFDKEGPCEGEVGRETNKIYLPNFGKSEKEINILGVKQERNITSGKLQEAVKKMRETGETQIVK